MGFKNKGGQKILLGSKHHFGDTLCHLSAIKKYRALHPETAIDYMTLNRPGFEAAETCHDFLNQVYFVEPDKFDDRFESADGYSMKEIFRVRFSRALRWRRSLPQSFGLYTIGVRVSAPFAQLSSEDVAAAKGLIEQHNLKHFIVFNPHASSDARKEWQAQRWAELEERLPSQYKILCIGSSSETAPPLNPDRVCFLYGLPIRTIGALLLESDLIVGLDSGIVMLSWALRARPILQLYANITPRFWSAVPYAKVIYGKIDSITVDSVSYEANRILSRKPMNAL